tara:strand:+ start:724 stop:930 length:207 start_codon:yes stop_codon:yes gene_type:complete
MFNIKEWLIGQIFSSKKFWYAVIGILTSIFSEKLDLDPTQVEGILISIGALILGQGFADFGKERRNEK